MTDLDARGRVCRLSCWTGPIDPVPLKGGITNANFMVTDGDRRFFVRIGDDIPIHGVMRFAELAASRAAEAVGLSPELIHHEPGALVFRFVDATTLTPEAVRPLAMLERILPLIRRCHREMPKHLRGPVLMFWPFHIFRDYAASLRDMGSRMVPDLPRLGRVADQLEAMVGPVELVFGHNDLLAANFLDAGDRLWLVDWDYAGYSSSLFDLANLSSNNDVAPEDERWLLENYFARTVDDGLWRRYHAMKCASLMRETMWSMIAEHVSKIDFDYVAYTNDYLARLDRALAELKQI
jgi:thiamine kinase-like enzyme